MHHGAVHAGAADAVPVRGGGEVGVACVVKRQLGSIKAWYERELEKNPSLAGKVVVKFVIARDGSVSKASMKSSTLDSPTAETCILRSFKRMRFSKQKGGGISVINYPFEFQAAEP